MKRLYGTAEVQKLTGATKREIENLEHLGFVAPERLGHRKKFRPRQIVWMRCIMEVRRKGISLQRLHGISSMCPPSSSPSSPFWVIATAEGPLAFRICRTRKEVLALAEAWDSPIVVCWINTKL